MTRSRPLLLLNNRQKRLRVPRKRFEQVIRAAQRASRRPVRPFSVTVVDDREMRRLHREWLGQDRATDVLSFALGGEAGDDPADPLGEVVVSAETAVREARRGGHPPTFELTLYVAHGVLHLLGHDDHAPEERRAMRAAERRVLKAAGIERNLFP